MKNALSRPGVRPAAVTALLLLVPLLAMQVSDEVRWSLFDFAFMGTLVFGTGLLYELAARKAGAYRTASGVALAGAFLLVWFSLGIGIIGPDGDPANLMYVGVLAVGVVGALLARFQPRGMARAMLAVAIAQAVVAGIALALGLGYPASPPLELVGLNGFFIALFLASAGLFQHAAQERHPQRHG